MVAIGTRAGREMTALITQMEQPLGRAVGNALEVKEAIDTLRGEGPADFQALTQAVAVEMVLLAGQADGRRAAAEQVHAGRLHRARRWQSSGRLWWRKAATGG